MELDRLKERYRGERAQNYDRDRVGSAEWQREQTVVEDFLHNCELRPKDVVVDIPVGTGRFLDFYKSLDCHVVGLDISDEMLQQAIVRAAKLDLDAELRIGDITKIEADDSSAKVVVCVRILNLLGFSDFELAISEAARVSSAYVIAGIQVRPRTAQEGGWWRRIASGRQSRKPLEKKDRSTEPHPEASVLREFRRRQLAVVRRELVVNSKSAIYYLYLLRKSK